MTVIMDSSSGKNFVAVVTGANAGVGFKLCERLIQRFPAMTLCLACRSKEKAEQAASDLRHLSQEAKISIVVLDTSSVESVFTAAEELKQRFNYINYLYLNAGMMSVSGVNWQNFWRGLFSTRVFHLFITGDGLLIHNDKVTKDGLQGVFSTNVFGHYLLLKELEKNITEAGKINHRPGQIIWTSSSNGLERNFSLDDIQHKQGRDPYSSSKYMIDSITVGLNERLNRKHIYVHTACPGLMMTNMTYGIFPVWFWTLLMPILFLLRLFVHSITHTPENGAESLVWLADQDPASIGPKTKVLSSCGFSGKPYVKEEKLKMSVEFSEQILSQLDALEDKFKKNFKK